MTSSCCLFPFITAFIVFLFIISYTLSSFIVIRCSGCFQTELFCRLAFCSPLDVLFMKSVLVEEGERERESGRSSSGLPGDGVVERDEVGGKGQVGLCHVSLGRPSLRPCSAVGSPFPPRPSRQAPSAGSCSRLPWELCVWAATTPTGAVRLGTSASGVWQRRVKSGEGFRTRPSSSPLPAS